MSVEKQNRQTPPEKGIFTSRFKVIDYQQDQIIMLWDMGDILVPKKAPEVWCGYEYWDTESQQAANKRLRFLCGLLNGVRERGDLLEL